MKKELRIGVLIKNSSIPAWFSSMLHKINTSKSATIVAVVYVNTNDIKLLETTESKKFSVYNRFRKSDRKKFKNKVDASLMIDMNEILKSNTFEAVETAIKIEEKNREETFKVINQTAIDILICDKDYIVSNDFLKTARFGVWKYYFGNIKANNGGPVGFWEVIENSPETGVTLKMVSINGTNVLYQSTHLTDPVSVERSLNAYYWKSLSILPRKIDELFRKGEEDFFKHVNKINKHPNFYSNKKYSIPTNGEMIQELFKFRVRRIKKRFKNLLFFNQWILLFKLKRTSGISTNFFEFTELRPPKDRFWADPHVIKRNNTFFIFIEELIYKENKGFISVIEMDINGRHKEPVRVLETDYHLSYPFIIEDNGELYMIPESKANKDIQLYKCSKFPYEWELETVLFENIEAVDTTVKFYNGKYWLFTNIIENKGASIHNELFLFSSDKLVSNSWKRHPQNPIVSDVSNARMAGKLFEHNSNLYRPSQNCSKHYGYGMKVNHVLEINETSYKEETIDEIYPNWSKNLHATHSIVSDAELTVIDAQIRRRKYF